MRKLLLAIIYLFVFLTIGALTLRNDHAVPFDALLWQGEVRLMWLLLMAFAVGALVTLMFILPGVLSRSWQLWRTQRRLRRLERNAIASHG